MHSWFVKLLDALLSIVILAPLVVAYWRGTFRLIENYLLTDYFWPSNLVSLAIALFGGIFFIYIQNELRDYIHSVQSPLSELMLKRIYCYIFGLVGVNHWRAVWCIWDRTTGFGIRSGAYCFGVGAAIMLLTRTFRCNMCPPLVAASDLHDDFFGIQNRFRVPRSKPVLFFLDSLFSVGILGSAVVCCCRGFWYIMDSLLYFPDHHSYTYLLSMGGGVVLVFVALLLQTPAAKISKSLEDRNLNFAKILFEDLFMLLVMVAGINIWRGVWGFCDVLVFPSDPMYSSWTCHVIGMGGLMLMFHGSSALLKGFDLDGEYKQGQGCYLPHSSLTIFKSHMGQTHRIFVAPEKHHPKSAVKIEETAIMMKGPGVNSPSVYSENVTLSVDTVESPENHQDRCQNHVDGKPPPWNGGLELDGVYRSRH